MPRKKADSVISPEKPPRKRLAAASSLVEEGSGQGSRMPTKHVENPVGNLGGRPTSALRSEMRGGLERKWRIAEGIAGNPRKAARDRIAALDFLAKYGLGPQHAMSREAVKAKLVQMDAAMRQVLPPELYAVLSERCRAIWNAEP
jgi:hypothetical protein